MMNKPLLLTLVVGIAVMMMFSVLPANAMNKGELVDAMAKDAGLSKVDAGNALNAFTVNVADRITDEGIKKSLIAKINKISKLTDEEKFKPAIKTMESFLKQIDALSGKKIETGSAEEIHKSGSVILRTLEELREMVMSGDNTIIKGDSSARTGRNPQTGATIKIASAETLTVGKGETLTGNIKVDGGTLIINQGTIDGNIKIINGGTLLINQDKTIRDGGKTLGAGQITEISQRAVVTGTIKVTDGTLKIEKSDIRRGIKADNSLLRIDTTTTGGDVEVKTSSIQIKNTTIRGDLKINRVYQPGDAHYGVVRVDTTTTGGDIEVKNSNISMHKVIIAGSLVIKDSSVNIDGVSVGENDNLQIKAKKVAKFKAGAALADTVK